ncbi:MAG: peptidylprolyl isomerase [Rhizobiales bacterium]|nr:peptidylprolyl isomerase [Rhizobacter sp.]
MLITSPCVVSLTWKLQDTLGTLIDELADPVEFFYGGDDLLAKVEEALAEQQIGFSSTLHLEPEHAFGDYDSALVFFEERSVFPDAIEVGMQFDGPPPGTTTPGMPTEAVYTVTEVYPGHVVLDGNHPLAGIALRLDLTVRHVRAATESEIEAGSVGQPVFTLANTAPRGSSLH